MTNLNMMTDAHLLGEFPKKVKEERRIAREVIEYIAEVERRKLYATEGCASTHAWLVKFHGYTHSSAGRRASAAKMLVQVPEAGAKVATGELSMSTLSRTQSVLRAEEKRTGEKIAIETKRETLEAIANTANVEVKLALFPQAAPKKQTIEIKNPDETRVHLTFTSAQLEKLKRVGEVLSHQLDPNSYVELIEVMADIVLKAKDPLEKTMQRRTARIKPNAAVNTTPIPPATRNFILKRDEGRCQFVAANGHKCRSRHRPELDHIIPRSHGGSNEPENLRLLCQTHNQSEADRIFGRVHMAKFR